MERLRKLARLRGAERWLLARAVLLLVVVRVGLWVLPFKTVERLISAWSKGPDGETPAGEASLRDVVWAVEAAGRCAPPATTCLTLALTARAMLRRRGHPALLHIGAAREPGGAFSAHAWVESAGRVVIGDHELERYAVLTTLGSTGP